MEALVSGELGVNARGCFALGEDVLIAPPRSVVEGEAIVIPGVGNVSVGEMVKGAGGYLEASHAQEYAAADCIAGSEGLVILSP